MNASSILNAAKNHRALILGNGPSIQNIDLSNCDTAFTVIGINASTLLEKRFGFITHYYTLSDRRFLTNPEKRSLATSLISDKTIRIVRSDLQNDDDETLRKKTIYARPLKRDGFSFDLNYGFYYGCTTAMLAIQVAFYIGCKEIYLVGIDLKYNQENPRFYKEDNPQIDDPVTSIQISNISNAYNQLLKNGVRLYCCSQDSFLRPYIPYASMPEIYTK